MVWCSHLFKNFPHFFVIHSYSLALISIRFSVSPSVKQRIVPTHRVLTRRSKSKEVSGICQLPQQCCITDCPRKSVTHNEHLFLTCTSNRSARVQLLQAEIGSRLWVWFRWAMVSLTLLECVDCQDLFFFWQGLKHKEASLLVHFVLHHLY